MALQNTIKQDATNALKQGDKESLAVLRYVTSEIKNATIEKKAPLSDEEVITVLERQIKMRQQSIAEFERGNRLDLVEKETKEIGIISRYLPKQMELSELRTLIEKQISALNAKSPADMGKVMANVMPLVKGKARGSTVSSLVKEILTTKSE